MKPTFFLTTLFFLGLLVSVDFAIVAQDSRYIAAMKKEIANVYKGDSVQKQIAAANAFERIANLNPTEWLPLYYQALALGNSAYMGGPAEKRDEALSTAEKLLEKASELSPANAEIVTLQGYITMGKLVVDPAGRAQSLSPAVQMLFGKALALDPENPRALALLAQMELGTARFMGSSTDKACKLAQSSKSIFEMQTAEPDAHDLSPQWGKDLPQRVLVSCN